MLNRATASALVLIVGAALIVASFVWPRMLRPTQVWSEEQARNFNQAAADVYRLKYEAAAAKEAVKGTASANNPPASNEKRLGAADVGLPVDPTTVTVARAESALAAAKQRYSEASTALESAKSRTQGPMAWLLWPGIILLIAGVLTASTQNQEA